MQSFEPNLYSDQHRVQAHLDVIQHLTLLLLRGEAGYLSAPQRRCLESIDLHSKQLLATICPFNQPELAPVEATHAPLQHVSQASEENAVPTAEQAESVTIVDRPLALPALHQSRLISRARLNPSALVAPAFVMDDHSIVAIDSHPNHDVEIRLPSHSVELTQITIINHSVSDANELRKLFSPIRRSEANSHLLVQNKAIGRSQGRKEVTG